MFNLAPGAVVGVQPDGDARALQRRKLMADAAELALKVGKLFAVKLRRPRQLLLRERAFFLQGAVGIGNGFDALFDCFVVGKPKRDFGFGDFAQLLRLGAGGVELVTQFLRIFADRLQPIRLRLLLQPVQLGGERLQLAFKVFGASARCFQFVDSLLQRINVRPRVNL